MKVPNILASFVVSLALHGALIGCIVGIYSRKEPKNVELLIVQIEGEMGESQLEEKIAAQEPPAPPPPPKPIPKQPQSLTAQEKVEETIKKEQNIKQNDAAKNDVNQAAQKIDDKMDETKELNKYLAALKKRMSSYIVYPREAKKNGYVGVPKVGFAILEDGTAENIHIVVSSGHEILDQSAMEAVRKSFPFDKPPRALREVSIDIYFKKE